jgi:FkbM family methyltransferase
MNSAVKTHPAAMMDPKLLAFKLLSMVPYQPIRAYARRGYFGRRRAYVSVDLNEILSELPDNPVIVDLGANEGSFSRQVSSIAAEIHAFEPDPTTFERLKSSLCAHDNIELYNMAVGPDDGEIAFFRGVNFESDPNSASLSSSTIAGHNNVDPSQSILVKQIGIISILRMIGKHVDLIKMDIEGSEVAVLERLLQSDFLNSVSILVVETHEHCIPSLVDRTFALRKVAKDLARPKIVMDWH